VSTGQLYGDIVYFATVSLVGVEICLPNPVYYWFYYIFMNGIWVVLPILIFVRSWTAISEAFGSRKTKTA
jgi:cholestenol delta-isomerase